MLLSGHQHASKTVVLIRCVSGESSPHNPTRTADDRQQGTRSPKNLYGILFYSLRMTEYNDGISYPIAARIRESTEYLILWVSVVRRISPHLYTPNRDWNQNWGAIAANITMEKQNASSLLHIPHSSFRSVIPTAEGRGTSLGPLPQRDSLHWYGVCIPYQ